ncbi:MAG: hypothetical protein J7639_07460 [Paenibacillaceae bacterium]|nr:hypothetical protein [Paenibacillaceae bacterium]
MIIKHRFNNAGGSKQTENEREYLDLLNRSNPIESLVKEFMKRQESEKIKDSGMNREHYMLVVEKRVRQFAAYQDARGAICDTFDGKEHEFATASFAKAGAI